LALEKGRLPLLLHLGDKGKLVNRVAAIVVVINLCIIHATYATSYPTKRKVVIVIGPTFSRRQQQ
jgi:hypothetical protein